MDILWAGWRSSYVSSIGEAETACLFCRLPAEDDDKGLILERGETAYSVLNLYPYTTGHLMVGPYRHAAELGDLTPAERAEVWDVLVRGQEACRAAMAPEGFNIGVNLGRVAGAGVPGHVHFHVVPRWAGDTNFMTAVGNARVIPEDITETWSRLRAALDAID